VRSLGLPRGGRWRSREEEEKPIPVPVSNQDRASPPWDRDTMGDSAGSVTGLEHAAWSCAYPSVCLLQSHDLKPSWLSALLGSEGEHGGSSVLSRNCFDLCLCLQVSEVQDRGKAREDLDLTLRGQFCCGRELDRTRRSLHVPLRLRNQI